MKMSKQTKDLIKVAKQSIKETKFPISMYSNRLKGMAVLIPLFLMLTVLFWFRYPDAKSIAFLFLLLTVFQIAFVRIKFQTEKIEICADIIEAEMEREKNERELKTSTKRTFS